MEEALRQVNFWDRYVSRQEFDGTAGWSLQNMLLVARAMVTSALEREESRGVHFRSDFPEPRQACAEHINLHAEYEESCAS